MIFSGAVTQDLMNRASKRWGLLELSEIVRNYNKRVNIKIKFKLNILLSNYIKREIR